MRILVILYEFDLPNVGTNLLTALTGTHVHWKLTFSVDFKQFVAAFKLIRPGRSSLVVTTTSVSGTVTDLNGVRLLYCIVMGEVIYVCVLACTFTCARAARARACVCMFGWGVAIVCVGLRLKATD